MWLGNNHANKGELKMARPRKTTEAGKIASEKWRQTMIEKYGGVTEKMREIGKIGGQNGKGPNYMGGFAADKERARIAGAKGGRISRRSSKYTRIMDENKEAIKVVVNSEKTLKEFATELGVPYNSLTWYVKTRIEGK